MELQLSLDKLEAQAKKAAKMLNVKLSAAGTADIAKETTKAADAQTELDKATKKTTSSLEQQLAAWRKLNAGGVAPGQKVIIATANAAKRITGNPLQPQAGGNTGAGLATPQAGAPKVIPVTPAPAVAPMPAAPAAAPAATPPAAAGQWKQILAAVVGTGVGGPVGGALAGVLTKVNPVVAATTAAMTALRAAVQQVASAMENARTIYARSLQSGFSTAQTTQRMQLSKAIGVGENEIYQYGSALEFLNSRLAVATAITAKTATILTESAYEWSILKENIAAMWATVAAALAPAINRLMELVSALVKLETLSGLGTMVGNIFGMLIEGVTRLIAITNLVPAAFMLASVAVQDSIRNLMEKLNNVIAGTKVGRMLGFEKKKETGFENTGQALGALKDVAKAAFGASSQYKNNLQPPQAMMKQLPASSWERMGLVIGAGGGTNYAKDTADHTKDMAGIMKRMLAQAHENGKFRIDKPQAVASAA